MQVTRGGLRVTLACLGTLVLISYGVGVGRMSQPAMDLWGGLKENHRFAFILPFMLLAVGGFIEYWRTTLFVMDEEIVATLRWPWGKSDGNGSLRLLVCLCLFLVPSALWIEATLFHMNHGYSWSPAVPITILIAVAVGNLLMLALGVSAYQDDLPGAVRMVIGATLLAIQCVINDAIIWTAMFPWFTDTEHFQIDLATTQTYFNSSATNVSDVSHIEVE